ncbi:MAG: arginine--tRNA ligase [Deltaproteobacteria bacterium]|nr:arginine--tRNA ligase [Deltaproteobacteria bacterium]
MRIERYFDEVAKSAIREALGVDAPAILKPTQDSKHGDYQVNGAMALGKQRKENPRDLATKIAAELVKHPAVAAADVAGPGFVNLRLDEAWIGAELAKNLDDPRDGVTPIEKAERIVVDYSSPNIAKQMHVGHLRSTILGHALVSMLRFVGHHVIGDNHVGDWGTQFGLLIAGLRKFRGGDASGLDIEGLEGIYRQASALSKDDESFANEARAELAKLQSGDAQSHALWQQFVDITRAELDKIYARMGVTFEEWLGESFYDPMLPRVIETVTAANIAREDQGALCIFFHEWAETTGTPAPGRLAKQKEPFIVRKKDGAFLYSTTDIATVMHRHEVLHASRAIYVVDARQALHFEQLFAVAARLGFTMRLEHVGFGTVLDENGKPIKTRDGKAITLASLLDEAEKRALDKLAEMDVELSEEERVRVAKAVGVGAVKYADLRQNRLSDYQFDFDKLIEFRGNSGPYMQYAAARVGSIFRKGGIDEAGFRVPSIALEAPEEKVLARTLLRFADVVHAAAESCQPHLLTDHLYALSRDFSTFIEACQVLKSEGATRDSRLALCALTGRQLRRGLVLLGIEPVERM